MRDPPAMVGDNMSSCTLTNGSRIKSLPGKSDSARGFSAPDLIVVDEAAYVEDELMNAVMPMLAVGKGRIFCLSTPAGRRGFFYHSWVDESEAWHREQVAATDCPRIDPAFLETQRARIGHHHFMSEYCCTFLDAEAQLFSGQHIEAALKDSACLPLHLVHEAKQRAWATNRRGVRRAGRGAGGGGQLHRRARLRPGSGLLGRRGGREARGEGAALRAEPVGMERSAPVMGNAADDDARDRDGTPPRGVHRPLWCSAPPIPTWSPTFRR